MTGQLAAWLVPVVSWNVAGRYKAWAVARIAGDDDVGIFCGAECKRGRQNQRRRQPRRKKEGHTFHCGFCSMGSGRATVSTWRSGGQTGTAAPRRWSERFLRGGCSQGFDARLTAHRYGEVLSLGPLRSPRAALKLTSPAKPLGLLVFVFPAVSTSASRLIEGLMCLAGHRLTDACAFLREKVEGNGGVRAKISTISVGWGTRIRTKTGGVRVRKPAPPCADGYRRVSEIRRQELHPALSPGFGPQRPLAQAYDRQAWVAVDTRDGTHGGKSDYSPKWPPAAILQRRAGRTARR
jgi:hypothetical protein